MISKPEIAIRRFPFFTYLSLLLLFVVFYTHRIMSILLIWEVVSIKVLLEYIIRRFILTIFRFWRMGRRRRQWGCLMRMVCLFIFLVCSLVSLLVCFLGGFVVWRMGEQSLVWLFVILFEALNLWIRIPSSSFLRRCDERWSWFLNVEVVFKYLIACMESYDWNTRWEFWIRGTNFPYLYYSNRPYFPPRKLHRLRRFYGIFLRSFSYSRSNRCWDIAFVFPPLIHIMSPQCAQSQIPILNHTPLISHPNSPSFSRTKLQRIHILRTPCFHLRLSRSSKLNRLSQYNYRTSRVSFTWTIRYED